MQPACGCDLRSKLVASAGANAELAGGAAEWWNSGDLPIVKRENLSRSGVRLRVRAPRPRERSEEWNARKKPPSLSVHMRCA